jgi:hypothetical protein
MSPFPYKPGDNCLAIRDIQRKLASLDPKHEPDLISFKTAPCNGNFNAETVNAIRAFRRMNGEPDPVGECDEATWNMLNAQAGSVFGETWQFEMDALRHGPVPNDVSPVRDNLAAEAHLHHFAGLAFSGGGIRSATFNLGMLQALAELRMLRDFDYLSTVSGGGYIGGWLSKWLKRQDGNVNDIENELRPGSPDVPRREPEEVKFLRQYTNYLTPKTGFFSADTWALLATYLRNTILNLTILGLILGALMVLPRLLAVFINNPDNNATIELFHAPLLLHFPMFSAVAVFAALWSVFWIAASVSGVPDPASKQTLWRQSQNSIIWFVVLPLMVAAFFGSAELWNYRKAIHASWDELFKAPGVHNPIVVWLFAPGVAYFVTWWLGWRRAQDHNRQVATAKAKQEKTPPPDDNRSPGERKALLLEGLGHFSCAMTVLAVGTVLVIMTTSALDAWQNAPPAQRTEAQLTPAVAQTVQAAQKVRAAAGSVTTSAQTVSAAAAAMTALAQRTPVPSVAVSATVAEVGAHKTVPLIAFGMPILLSLFGVTMILSVGLVGRLYSDKSREWWSRQAGWTAIFGTGWIALITVSLYAPAVVGYFHTKLGDWASAAVSSAWLGTTVLGLILGKSGATGVPTSKSRLDWLARAAPLLFSVGALFIVSNLLHTLLLPHGFVHSTGDNTSFIGFLAAYDIETMERSYANLGFVFVGLVAIGVVLAWRVDINKFSLHIMYRNRLVRAYLGASNQQRQPHPFTGFDPADDEHLDDLLKPNGKLIQRPYHIINTALNLVNGKELAWQTRKAANFTFTPAFCGFELPSMASPGGIKVGGEAMRGGFRRTNAYRPKLTGRQDEERGINLGMTIAVSGAAASPSMGYHSSPPLAFLMTLFNVRLGRWFANPVRQFPQEKINTQTQANTTAMPAPAVTQDKFAPLKIDASVDAQPAPPRTSPSFGLWYLLKELFGLTDAKSNFVYLSDGGHFENLGIYELVRRRCRLIVVVDAGADGQFDFEDLGNAIRKCGTDLYVEVEIDVGKIDLLKSAEFSRAHCVTGTIRYDKVDRGAPVGTLLYIKPSLLGTEFADVLNYRKTNKTFPHQPTADQWFDETQFETYRSPGYNIGKIVLEKAAGAALKNALGRHDIMSLCDALQANWPSHAADNADLQTTMAPLRLVPDDRAPNNRRMANRRHPQAIPNLAFLVATERRMSDDRRSA